MNFSDYFEKYLLNDLSIKEKIKQLEERELICNNIINCYEYIEWLIDYLENKRPNNNIVYLDYFYFAIKDFLEENYFYEFYDYSYFVLKYKDYFIEFKYNDNLNVNLTADKDIYVDFNNIVNKEESPNKEKYLNYFNELIEMKKVLPKKLLKEKID